MVPHTVSESLPTPLPVTYTLLFFRLAAMSGFRPETLLPHHLALRDDLPLHLQ